MCTLWLLSTLGLASPSVAQSPEPLRVGAISYKSEADFQSTYTPMVEYLAAELDREPQFTPVEGDRLAFQLAAGDFDLGVFTPFPYLKAKLDFPELEVFASHVVRGSETYRGAILVGADSGIESLQDLQGKSILFVKPTSTSGFKLPEGILRENGLDQPLEHGEHEFSGGHEASVRRLLAGEVDGIAIDLEALGAFSAEERAGLRVLEEYHVPYHAYVFSPRLGRDARRRIQEAMLAAHRNPDNGGLFTNPLGIERWTEREDTFYNGLRRYLGMVRSKPQLAVKLTMKPSARRVLEPEGDFIEVLDDTIKNELRRTRRFELQPPDAATTAHEVAIDMALVGEEFHCQFHLDGEWMRSVDLPQSELLTRLPELLIHDVLAASPIESPLLFNGSDWFITHGLNDGISLGSYDFTFSDQEGDTVQLPPESVRSPTPLNTFFSPDTRFRRGAPMTLTYRVAEDLEATSLGLVAGEEGTDAAVSHGHDEASQLRGFWSNLDNRWGVIGLLLASMSVALGAYLRARKHRRFRTVLNESLDLLRLYIEGKYDLQVRLIEQREKILSYLEKNFINENQYLILKHHLDEVEAVIAKLASQEVSDTLEVQAELQQIVRDGKVTAEELEHLASTLRQASGEEESVS